MKMVFLAAGLDGIASGSPPSEKPQKEKWDLLDRQMLAYLYMAISDDFQYLVEDEATASAGWKKLVEYFQRSTLGARMVAQKEFICHSLSRTGSCQVVSLHLPLHHLPLLHLPLFHKNMPALPMVYHMIPIPVLDHVFFDQTQVGQDFLD